ncbi:class I SAM-dependent methyltransferase [Hugenholtzia roseola]|uniref:class I SAM-dependent methyltransferase n=1 Tax=Hugenholtzia roseola TaxID=1002 RepID=UPI00040EC8D0|nr:class I SAM-dependent methyltransferase [Hugenholtzia roseola]
MFKTTEITAYTIPSDNVIHQRLLFAYEKTVETILKSNQKVSVLEIGSGAGKGAELLAAHPEVVAHYTAIDKNNQLVPHLQNKYPHFKFVEGFVPPLPFQNESFDWVITQQVIEHIEDDSFFLTEIHRVLKKGGKAIITTPNKPMSLTRNPWHVREYNPKEMHELAAQFFAEVELWGITGDKVVWDYYEKNKQSVAKFKRLDIFNLEQNLPRTLLQVPYDLLNRWNRNKLKDQNDGLVAAVTTENYRFTEDLDTCFDFFCIVTKN